MRSPRSQSECALSETGPIRVSDANGSIKLSGLLAADRQKRRVAAAAVAVILSPEAGVEKSCPERMHRQEREREREREIGGDRRSEIKALSFSVAWSVARSLALSVGQQIFSSFVRAVEELDGRTDGRADGRTARRKGEPASNPTTWIGSACLPSLVKPLTRNEEEEEDDVG